LVHAAPATTSTDVVAANKRALSEVERAVSRLSPVASVARQLQPRALTAAWIGLAHTLVSTMQLTSQARSVLRTRSQPGSLAPTLVTLP
jgi:hypothetical protein